MGGSKRKSKDRSVSSTDTFVDPNQQPFLNFLRGQGVNLASGQLNPGSGFQQGIQQGQQAISGLLDPTVGQIPQAIDFNIPAAQNNPGLQAQIRQGQQLINRNLQENVLPSIGSNAQAAGQQGSSRQGIAEGIAARSAIESQANLAENLLFQDFERVQQQNFANAQLAGQLGLQQQQQLGTLGLQQQQLAQQGQLGALQASPSLAAMQFSPLTNLAGIIGGPTVLERSRLNARGSSRGKSLGF